MLKTALLPNDIHRRNQLLSAVGLVVFWNLATLIFDPLKVALPLSILVLVIAVRPIWLMWEWNYVITGFLFLFGLLLVAAAFAYSGTLQDIKLFLAVVLGLPGVFVPIFSVCRFFDL